VSRIVALHRSERSGTEETSDGLGSPLRLLFQQAGLLADVKAQNRRDPGVSKTNVFGTTSAVSGQRRPRACAGVGNYPPNYPIRGMPAPGHLGIVAAEQRGALPFVPPFRRDPGGMPRKGVNRDASDVCPALGHHRRAPRPVCHRLRPSWHHRPGGHARGHRRSSVRRRLADEQPRDARGGADPRRAPRRRDLRPDRGRRQRRDRVLGGDRGALRWR
jgi:hypothetical protein